MKKENEIREEIEELNEQIKVKERELRALTRKRGVQEMANEFTSLFEEVPDLVGFEWEQYTPYFNDGSPCEFTVYTPDQFLVKKSFVETLEADQDYYTGWGEDTEDAMYICPMYKTTNESLLKLRRGTKELGWMEDELKEMFGDHAKVVVRRDSIEVFDTEGKHD